MGERVSFPSNGHPCEGYFRAPEARGKEVELKVYPNADHAFFHDSRPEVHEPAAAADAWKRTLELFQRSLR